MFTALGAASVVETVMCEDYGAYGTSVYKTCAPVGRVGDLQSACRLPRVCRQT